ncbi:MAG: hypothetical protein ACRCY8_05220 [Dermatophilaceae bacterium]
MTPRPDARRVELARAVLLEAGGDELGRRPWQHPKESPEDAALVRFALWHATSRVGSAATPELEAGLALIESARSDLDAAEAALVFTARAEGLTWARIAEAMGLRSPQAAQQRYQRTAERPVPSSRGHVSTGDRD